MVSTKTEFFKKPGFFHVFDQKNPVFYGAYVEKNRVFLRKLGFFDENSEKTGPGG
jgi:hypothetical protein